MQQHVSVLGYGVMPARTVILKSDASPAAAVARQGLRAAGRAREATVWFLNVLSHQGSAAPRIGPTTACQTLTFPSCIKLKVIAFSAVRTNRGRQDDIYISACSVDSRQ